MSAVATPERPQYLESARLDDLARMVTELTSELWILKDRNMILEKILEDNGVLTGSAVDEYQPDVALSATLLDERRALAERIFGAISPSDERVARALTH
ncbi:hypothetical protein [Rhodococcus globerulus]|uniref:Uncharacterized protein n=1 Tax=Rhodococcus globerulus TaxID=33008 RepID=A0ABU4BR49_RHOGO|nr:hypothetical protein [Rhodococcus globerulus]MCE4265439.1 hypothetical protein [Rhodococcus globerulus]MDV6266692.1 hypothetical protein [Rhodococcus globerulus]